MKRLLPLLLILLFLYMWSSRLGTDGYELEYLLSAGNLIRHGSIALPSDPSNVPGVSERPPGILHLPRHNFLQVFLTVPFYLAGMPFNRLFTPLESGLFALPMGSLLAISLLNPLLTVVAVMIIFLIGRELGYSDKVCRRAALVYGFATMAWPYAAIGMEPLQVVTMLVSFLFFIRLKRLGTLRESMVLALAITGLMHTKISAPLLALPVAVAGVIILIRKKRFRAFFAYTAMLGISTLIWVMLYELRKRGFYSEGFFRNFNIGLMPRNVAGMLISPGKSLFVYSPILLWCLPGVSGFFSRYRSLAIVMTITAAACMVLTACWDWSLVEECWGPRYLMPLVPMLIVMGFDRFQPVAGLRKWLVYVPLLILSMLVQIPGALYPNACLLLTVHNEDVPIVDLATWAPDLSPVWVGWRLIGQKTDETFGRPVRLVSWNHYRGIVGHGTRPTVTEFNTRQWNRPYAAPFLAARYMQRPLDGINLEYPDPRWIFMIWMAVTLAAGGLCLWLGSTSRCQNAGNRRPASR